MAITRAASHQPTRWRPMAAVLAAVAIAALALATAPAVTVRPVRRASGFRARRPGMAGWG
jgi:hypothetical protein